MLNTDQFIASNKASLETMTSFAFKAFEGLEQITALNMQAVKTTLGEAAETTAAVMSSKDPQSLVALQAGLIQPAAEKAAAYGRQVYDIVLSTKAEAEKIGAAQFVAAQRSLLAAVDAVAANAPDGSTGGVDLLKSAIAAANNTIDGFQKAARQVGEAAEANYTAHTSSVVKAASKSRRA